jgi:LmbE family N-acetylglucosaminyl deacetylase
MTSLKLLLIAFAGFISALFTSANAALFIAAHPDDVAYLMHKNAQSDVASGYPTVFVLMTAGDAGNGTGLAGNTMKVPYYRARLKAMELYVHFWQGLNPNLAAPVPTYSTEAIKGKYVESIHMGNVVLYNLNLPDNTSLMQLYKGQIKTVSSISPINTYTLPQVLDVLREILRKNNPATQMININTQDPDSIWNPGDHTDHLATGAIAKAAYGVAPWNCANMLYYRGYVIAGFPQVFSEADIKMHEATIGVLNAGLIANGNRSTWDDFHNGFLGRMYLRGEMGTGNCWF